MRILLRFSRDNQLAIVFDIVRQLVSRLIQLQVIGAGHDHYDDVAVLAFVDSAAELHAFSPPIPALRRAACSEAINAASATYVQKSTSLRDAKLQWSHRKILFSSRMSGRPNHRR